MKLRALLCATVALVPFACPTPVLAVAAMADGDQIVVTAAAREQEVKNAPASISVIDREQLERMPYREVTDALLEVPGVTVSTGEGNSRDISIRGMSPEYTLILVDGKRLSSRESRTNGGNISEGGMLPPLESIERIEVVRGPMSSLYGSDAMGGVVNIITRRIADDWRGSARINGTMQLGSDYGNYADGNFYLSGPVTGGIGLQLQGSINRREGDKVIGGTPRREDETLAGKIGFKAGDNHDFLVEAGYYKQKVTTVAGETVEASDDEPTGTQATQTQERYVTSVSHSGRWGFANSESYLQYEDAKNIESEKRIRNLVGQSIWTVPLPSNMLNVGVYFRKEDLKDLTGNRLSGSTLTGTTRTAWALFAENELRLLDGFALTGGLRMDEDEQYGTHWTPRVYAVWNIDRAFTLKGGYSQGFRAPNLRETLKDWGQSSRGGTIYGNPDLKPETSRTIEASLLFESRAFQATLSAFDTRYNDKITRVTCVAAGAWCVDEPLSTIGRPPTTYVNVDKAKIRGIEASVDVRLSKAWRVTASGTLTDSEQLTGAAAGAALNDTPKQQASLSLNWKPDHRLSGFARAVYRGREAVTEAQISGTNVFAPSYTVVDIGASYRITRDFTFHGGVQNLLDKRLDYETAGFVIDPARLWMGVSARF
ncbi:TonB-dependent receptor domain-containing protein [Sphingobium sp.]|uniref:TonB-dependent receptor domain-containing protein n=1 Tax=Sphingobium sp. TaxID=1912891 RepID=UPI002BFEA7BD|nr:TonB-dependent receptor [Sphingobium sp.]HUD92027.1 TonB-dependent receptor [Sphingobium sp.]